MTTDHGTDRWPTSPAIISPRPSPIPMARPISAMPTRRSQPMQSPVSCGSTATTCSSSPAPTSTASKCCRPRPRRSSLHRNWSNAVFIRTTEERHHRASIAIWQRMEAAGDIYLGKYSGWYSVRDEAYYDEDETRLNDDGERVGPQGTPVEWVEEESYFFKLSAYQQKLLDLYTRHPDYVLPKERLNEVVAFVKGSLQDLSISRTTFDWGVKVPGNPKH